MQNASRLRSLEDRHAQYDARVAEEAAHPRPDALKLAELKKEKLRLKQEIERLRAADGARPPGPAVRT